ncbi:MAG: HEAT repeat domain-containing protein [Candidatus Sulfotelmatobacter sp.]
MDVFRPNVSEQAVRERQLSPAARRALNSVAMMAGVGFALLLAIGGGPVAVWGKTAGLFSLRTNSELSAAESSGPELSETDLDNQRPQKQAELLLERAVSHSVADPNHIEAQIESRSDAWRGHLQWDSQLGDLTTVALNSRDLSVRASAIEVQLAAYGLTKTESTVDAMVRQADSRDQRRKIWALWALGLLGNRGVEPERVVQVLAAHLKDPGKNSDADRNNAGNNNKEDKDEDARRWAVEGLALVGTTPTIAPLLETMRNDPSPVVREHAACSLAQSGMLSREQRLIAVPQLIDYSADPALDVQTRAWAFQALAEITKQHLPNDSVAWRGWYQTSVASGR